MTSDERDDRRRKVPRPLDAARLNELALAYVARFATSSGRLRDYLTRKLRERGWDGDAPPDVAALVDAMVARGYVDDAGYAQARGDSLLRRGFGARRIAQTLGRDGIAAPLVAEASGSPYERRQAALAFARRRRLGPFARGGHEPLDRAARSRQVAAMVRAGHSPGTSCALIDAADPQAAQQWVDEADDS